MDEQIDRLKLKRALRDEAFWIVVLPLIASLHPDVRDFLMERWELLLGLLAYLAHNGYLRGKVVSGASEVMAAENVRPKLELGEVDLGLDPVPMDDPEEG